MVRRLPSAVRTATPAFDVRSSDLFCGRPGGLELVNRLPIRDPSRFFDSFCRDLKTVLDLLANTAIMRSINLLLTLTVTLILPIVTSRPIISSRPSIPLNVNAFLIEHQTRLLPTIVRAYKSYFLTDYY